MKQTDSCDAVQLQPATTRHAENLVELYHAAYEQSVALGFLATTAWVDLEAVETWVREDTVFLATIEAESVGTVRLAYYDDWDRLVLGRLGVAPEWTQYGIVRRNARSNGWSLTAVTPPISTLIQPVAS